MAAIFCSVFSFLVLFVNTHSMNNTTYEDADNRSLSTNALEMDEAETTSKMSDGTPSTTRCIESMSVNLENERVLRPEDYYFNKNMRTTEVPLNITTEVLLNITTEVPLNITTEVRLNITTEVPLNITTEIRLNITTEVPLNITTDTPAESSDASNCTRVFIEPECYMKFNNGSVYVPLYNMMFNETEYIINNHTIFVCPDFTDEIMSNNKITEQIPVILLACVVISTLCLLLYTVIFFVFKEMRNLQDYCMQSLTVALLSTYASIYIHYVIDNVVGCTVLGMFILYFTLSSFFWMNTISYDVWKSIRLATAKFRPNTNKPIIALFARYSLYAWGSPLMIIIISLIINSSVSELSTFKLTFNASSCWFEYKQAFVMYFAGPSMVLFSSNIFFFISIFYTSDAASNLNQANSQSDSDLMPRFFLTLRLGSVMGFWWLFGITATLTEMMWLWYLCAVFSGLQGVCILFNFTVFRRLKNAFMKAKNRNFSATPTSTTSTGGTPFLTEQPELHSPFS